MASKMPPFFMSTKKAPKKPGLKKDKVNTVEATPSCDTEAIPLDISSKVASDEQPKTTRRQPKLPKRSKKPAWLL